MVILELNWVNYVVPECSITWNCLITMIRPIRPYELLRHLHEKPLSTANAFVHARVFVPPVLACEWSLSAYTLSDVEWMRWDLLLELLFVIRGVLLNPLFENPFIFECALLSLLVLKKVVSHQLSLRINSNVYQLFEERLDFFRCLRCDGFKLSCFFLENSSLCF